MTSGPKTTVPDDRIGRATSTLDTPALVVDLDVLDANIERIAAACRSEGIAWRPHVKSVSVPAIAQRLIDAGAIGVTVAKLSAATVMVDAGIDDVLVANQVVGQVKIARLMELLRRASVTVAVDDLANVDALEAAATAAGLVAPVVIEVDLGLRRAGVPPGDSVVALAGEITRRSSLRFAGLMGWEGPTAYVVDPAEKAAAIRAAVGLLVASADACRAAGLPVRIVSCGGTGTYATSARVPGVTEIQAGGGIFSDVRYRTKVFVDHPYALTVLSTVTSRPTPTRIVCDAGKKTMSSDAAVPLPIGLDGVRSVALSAEHATIELEEPTATPAAGDTLAFVVGYSDTTIHLNDELVAARSGIVEDIWPVLGRGSSR
jgi:D-serine deaminase-like pyridoxal phosphate-dependent protein